MSLMQSNVKLKVGSMLQVVSAKSSESDVSFRVCKPLNLFEEAQKFKNSYPNITPVQMLERASPFIGYLIDQGFLDPSLCEWKIVMTIDLLNAYAHPEERYVFGDRQVITL